jgi:ribosomal protection tetracycline resistance protein
MSHSGQVPESTAGDYRSLTPLVLMSALAEAGTTVLEPMHRARLEVPADTLGAAVALLARVQAIPDTQEARGSAWLLEGQIPAARVHELQLQVPAVTRGEGVLECEFEEYRPVSGTPPVRHRSDRNPLNREEYLLHVARRV